MPLAVILSGTVIFGVYRTKTLAGFWGFLDDEIAVVTIESDEDGQQNITIKDPSKSFWDILEVLGVPLVLAVLGAWFQKTQQEQADRIARDQRDQDGDEIREEVLQLYFDRISALLIDKNLMAIATKSEKIKAARVKGVLAVPTEQEELLEVAIDVIQARTLSILRRFEQDSERKSSVIRFLIEADAIARLKISFSQTELSDVSLSFVNLSRANLSRATLRNADLKFAILIDAILINAILSDATLISANLHNADLSGANLSSGNLSFVILSDANLVLANLSDSNLRNADLSRTNLNSANLSNANLSGADIINADLIAADLIAANLLGANLLGANLLGANLSNAKGLTKEQLSEARLCNTKLPSGIDLDPNRDCELLRKRDE